MLPEYVARKSACAALSFLWILSCILIIPAIILAFRIVAVKKYRIEFYKDKIIIHSGWLNVKQRTMVFMGVTSADLEKSLFSSIFNYGTVRVDCVGKWDVNSTTYIKDPEKLQAYLQKRIVKATPVATPAYNPFVMM